MITVILYDPGGVAIHVFVVDRFYIDHPSWGKLSSERSIVQLLVSMPPNSSHVKDTGQEITAFVQRNYTKQYCPEIYYHRQETHLVHIRIYKYSRFIADVRQKETVHKEEAKR